MIGHNGGLIGAARDTGTTQSVPGVWTLREQLKAKRASNWPVTIISGGEDPYFYSNSLLLYGDGVDASTAIVDSSLNNHTITVNGDAQISTNQSKFGGSSLYFDGNGDYLTSPTNTDFEFGTGDFTVEFWAFFNSIARLSVTLGNGASGSGSARAGWSIFFFPSTNQFFFYRFDGSTETPYTFSFTPSTLTWYHIAVSRSGTSLRFFVDGVQIGSTVTTSVSYNAINTQPLTIGRLIGGANDSVVEYHNGYIDDLRITKGVARYTANFTPPVAAFSTQTPVEPHFFNNSLLLFGDGSDGSTNIIDSSSNNHAITVNGNAQISTTQSKYGVSSLYFDGSGDYLSVADSDDFHIGASDFTVETWIYKGVKGAFSSLVGQRAGSITEWRIILDINTAGNGYSEGTFRFDWGSTDYNWNAQIPANTWTHIALVRSGTTGTLYVNGIAVTGSPTLNNIGNYAAPLRIGTTTGTGDYYQGYIQDLRITKGVARYTSNFTPPLESFSSPSTGFDSYFFYNSLLLRGNGTNGSTAILDSSSNTHAITVNGNAQISTTQSKFGGSSLYFDGSGDSITVPDSSDWHFGSDDFTIEVWVYPTAITNTSAIIVSQWGNTGSSGTWFLSMDASNIYALFSSGTAVSSPYVAVVTPYSLNQWQHIAVVRNGTTLSIYLNGTLSQSATISFAVADAPEALSIGRQLWTAYRSGEPYQGYMDDLRITKGIARYTANFTPPGAL